MSTKIKFKGDVPEYARSGSITTIPELIMAVTKDARAIKTAKKELITEEVGRCVVTRSPKLIEYIPNEVLTKVVCLLAAQIYAANLSEPGKGEDFLAYIPENLRTDDVIIAAVKACHLSILNIEKSRYNLNFVKRMINVNPNAIFAIPKEFLVKEVYKLAVERDGRLLRIVPDYIRDDEIIRAALKQNGQAILIDRANGGKLYQNPSYLAIAMESSPPIGKKPEFWQNREFAMALLKENPFLIKEIPAGFSDDEIVDYAVGKSVLVLNTLDASYVSEHLITRHKQAIIEILNIGTADNFQDQTSEPGLPVFSELLLKKMVTYHPDLVSEIRNYDTFTSIASWMGIEYTIDSDNVRDQTAETHEDASIEQDDGPSFS